MKLLNAALLVASAAAFNVNTPATLSTSLNGGKEELVMQAEACNPIVKFYDPLNLSGADFWGQGEEATIGFIRHSEIKHSRVAMAAFVGYIIQAQGIHFPWKLGYNSEYIASHSPAEQWDNFAAGGKWQIFVLISFLEVWDECGGGTESHYMSGRKPGAYPSFKLLKDNIGHPIIDLYDPFGFSKNKSQAQKDKGLVTELNNGRAAMIGIFGFLAESKIEGSVPLLTKFGIPHYSGEFMQPFEGQFSYFGN
ncbi:hypothetical protein ScalyP_jg9472 [Parmales sp. scaly parma]|nr:hypothetical protein ScalyP_jg9472 [Parmales sp. scaly parma]